VEKIGIRWWLCTPAGNAFWMKGVFNADSPSSIPDQGISYDQIILSKYGDRAKWGNQIVKRIQSWGFNSIGDYGSTYVYPFGRTGVNPILLPMNPTMRLTSDGLINRSGFVPSTFKSLTDSISLNVYTGYNGGGMPDVFDPAFDNYVNGSIAATAADPYWKQWLTSPWIIGVAPDDMDDLFGFGPGLEVRAPDGAIAPHVGWLALASSPTKSASAKYSQTYTDTKVYSKARLIMLLQAKYGVGSTGLAAMNAAWNSNYTSWGSSNGWPKSKTGSSGLLDEDGSSPWLGNRDASMINSNTNVQIDLDNFLSV
jgi:hypothetical protein